MKQTRMPDSTITVNICFKLMADSFCRFLFDASSFFIHIQNPQSSLSHNMFGLFTSSEVVTTTWTKRLSCHAGYQEVSKCCTRGESEESIECRPGSTQVMDPKYRDISGPTKRTEVLQKCFFF